jgi:DNA repair protein RadA/Sms
MHSSLRCLFHFRSPSLRCHILGYTQTLQFPICRSFPPRFSCTDAHLSSFDSEDEEETKRERSVSTYYDPVQDRLVTSDQRVDYPFRSISQVGTSDRESEEEEEEEGNKSGRIIWEKSRKLEGKEGKTGSPKISLDIIKRKAKNSKSKAVYQCDSCGSELSQWWGMCPKCGAGPVSLREHDILEVNPKRGAEVSEALVRSWLRQKPSSMVPKTLVDINKGRDQSEWRIQLYVCLYFCAIVMFAHLYNQVSYKNLYTNCSSGLFGMEISRVLGGGIVPGMWAYV